MNTLYTFTVAARRLNFSQAADELNLTHAAVSTQIKKLEEWFGRRLFERTSRGILLNEAGQELLFTVEAALHSVSITSQKLRVTRNRKSISVACLPSITSRWLVPGMSDFLGHHPDVAIELSYAEAHKPFDRDRHDVLISHFAQPPEGLSATRLFGRTSRPVASHAYIERQLGTLDNRLDGARLLHDASTQGWEDWFRAAGFRPTRISHGPVYPDFNVLITAVLAGQGVALCPVEVFRKDIARGDIEVLSDIATQTDEAYYLVTEEEQSPVVAAFVRWFCDFCRD